MLFGRIIFTVTLLCSYQIMADCLNTENNNSAEFLQQNKTECLANSHFLLNSPDMNLEENLSALTNPLSKIEGLVNGSVVYCRYSYQKQNGASAKFRCARTNELNQLMDSKSRIVPEATGLLTEGDEVYLINQNNEKINEETKSGKLKFKKAHIMKVRYQDGGNRNVENYTSSAASRIFWALGIPAHSNYMTEKIVCFGCGADPFHAQKAALLEAGKFVVTEFKDASIEVKFSADRLYNPTQQPWKWAEINQLHSKSTNELRTEIEVFALASQFIGITGTSDIQNAIVCTKYSEENKSVCEEVIAMAHDLGAAFGSRLAKGLFSRDYPRGDLTAFKNTSIFKEGSCIFNYSDGGKELPVNISNSAQLEFLKRAESLTPENLKLIFAASHMGRLQNQNSKKIKDLESRWIEVVQMKLQEIKNAPCK